jgi:hypothetical protein
MMRHDGTGWAMDGMHWGGVIVWLLLVIVLVLAIAALAKYLRAR